MFDSALSGLKRRVARGTLGLLFSAHFMRRRALAILSRHYAKGELVLRYRMRDHVLYLNPSDDVITARILLRGDWQRGDLERVVEMLKVHVPAAQGRLFVDVGGNIGSQTVYAMLSGFFSGAVVVEPEPQNFLLLEENLAANHLSARVKAFNCAAAARAGTMFLVRSTWNKGGHAIDERRSQTSSNGAIAVEVRPLQAILREAGIAAKDLGLVWIDVNGTELSVLQGMTEILECRVPIVIEHLPSLISVETARAVHRLLSSYYTSFCRIDDATIAPAPVSKMDPLRDTGDFLFF